jgi:ABC-2 type transport system ATP-binding protein
MKQRLALARTLVHQPRALFLDEPTAALDPVAAREVHELIREFAADDARSVVVTTHNLVEAQQLCDRVVILRSGRSIADGTPAEISGRLGTVARVVIEVGAGQGPGAETALREDTAVSVEAAGDVLTITGVDRDRIPAIVATLAGRGTDVYRVSPAEASLEDAYFALHDDAARP